MRLRESVRSLKCFTAAGGVRQAFRVSHMQDIARHQPLFVWRIMNAISKKLLQQLGLWSSGMTSS